MKADSQLVVKLPRAMKVALEREAARRTRTAPHIVTTSAVVREALELFLRSRKMI